VNIMDEEKEGPALRGNQARHIGQTNTGTQGSNRTFVLGGGV